MIPAGFETKNGFMFDDDYYDDEDDFEFDFGDKNTNNNPKPVQNLILNGESQKLGDSTVSEFGLKANISKHELKIDESNRVKPSAILYKLNTTYYYNEFEFVIDDLKKALLSKNLSLVQSLFKKHNLNANCKLKSNWTPLMYSVSSGSYEITRFLIEKGADVKFDDGNIFVCKGFF